MNNEKLISLLMLVPAIQVKKYSVAQEFLRSEISIVQVSDEYFPASSWRRVISNHDSHGLLGGWFSLFSCQDGAIDKRNRIMNLIKNEYQNDPTHIDSLKRNNQAYAEFMEPAHRRTSILKQIREMIDFAATISN